MYKPFHYLWIRTCTFLCRQGIFFHQGNKQEERRECCEEREGDGEEGEGGGEKEGGRVVEGEDSKSGEKEKEGQQRLLTSMSLAKIYGLGPAPYFELKKAHITVEDDAFF